ncbi:hydrogenase [Thermococcus guaymasensis DSM 11113]|uniref:Hydrogenase n=1 Tax=Thermococcus guaymasensis DSM 11113 TaxID=1432656 RepID=A0A0X1KJD7_9EURY|nr:proton-conducting transporter membrane subunit [Thermococcus guaymasensis]AJC71360.1 hydrogenase [Thermococcus guaymasensis DSM 11113]
MILEYAIGAFILGGLIGLIRDYKASVKASSFIAFLGSLALLWQVYAVYTNGPVSGDLFGIPVRIDDLSIVFLLIIGLVGAAASLYAINYMELFEKVGKGWVYAVAYNTFLASMVLVVTVDSMEYFVMSWELMTLSSFILVFFSEKARDVNASVKYYITMHFLDTIPLFLALGTAYSLVGSFEELTFENIHTALLTAPESTKWVLTALLMVAFMAKAGIVPFQFWVAETYRAAPTSVSAVMAGAMEKVAIYGLIALIWRTVGTSYSLGLFVATLGAITLTVGTLYALRETNAKRLLAYHSIGQMGYIWLGIGIGMALIPKGGFLGAVGALGAFAGLFHALNHAIFKASLFLSAGAVEYRTGTVDLNELGGLGKTMKGTALAALFASLAISGVPPFNGFISKWLIYVSGYYSNSYILALGAVLAAFISAATLASFIKFYGTQFGGEMKRYENVQEAPVSMLIGQWILAGLTLLIGVFPRTVTGILNDAVTEIPNVFNAPIEDNIYKIGFQSVMFSPVMFVILLGALAVGLYFSFRPEYGKTARPWDCGSTEIDEDEYRTNAEGYYNWYEEKIGSFYHLGDWFYRVGAGAIHYLVRAYLWMASYFTKIVDTPYTKVETLDDLREREIMHIDEEVFKPLIRFLNIARDVIPGIRLGTFVVLALVVVGAIIGILIVL